MPKIYEDVGIYFYFYFKNIDKSKGEHEPPHLHLEKPGYSGKIFLNDLRTEGKLSSSMIKVAKEFIKEHKSELLKMWKEQKFYEIKD